MHDKVVWRDVSKSSSGWIDVRRSDDTGRMFWGNSIGVGGKFDFEWPTKIKL